MEGRHVTVASLSGIVAAAQPHPRAVPVPGTFRLIILDRG